MSYRNPWLRLINIYYLPIKNLDDTKQDDTLIMHSCNLQLSLLATARLAKVWQVTMESARRLRRKSARRDIALVPVDAEEWNLCSAAARELKTLF
jgi:hypothetical protein